FQTLGSRAAVTDAVANRFYSLLFPAIFAALSAQERGTMELELTKTTFAIAAYRADAGKFPEKLEDLVPKYLAKVPHDIFTGAPLHYRYDEQGCELHCSGPAGNPYGA